MGQRGATTNIWQRGSFKEKMYRQPQSGGIPNRLMAQHPYYATGTVASSAAFESVAYVFRLRSMFDPDLTATGHQPRGRDQLVGLGYTHYKVHGVKIDCKMTYNTTESDYPSNLFAIYLSGSTDPFVDPEALMELGQCSECVLLKRKWVSSNNSGQNNALKECSLRYVGYQGNLFQKACRFNYAAVGPQAQEYFDYNSYTSVTTNPDTNTEVFLNLVAMGPGNGVTTAQGFQFWIKLTYYCEWVFPGVPTES